MGARAWPKWLAITLLLVAVGYFAAIYRKIIRTASQDQARAADVIVVFGAAEYVGRPSPVFKARLDHGLQLFRRGLAPFVITTGGAGADPRFTEGEVGREYLRSRGIPDDQLIAETQGFDTAESARRVAAIMRTNHMKTCLAVSDGYHMFRIKQMLAREGVIAYGAPRPNSRPQTFDKRNEAVLHEIGSYTLWLLHVS